ncbi:Methyltransferase domain-containing protein [Sinosporangium album]|uniref:Methyltransferase domain-containing protein n=1 Tax=Sinosporangium album TaxID=504805 RepID=A0A1G8GPZ5_9ACTN|nr:class I SAM-dependent methyltransferase [Sinosporangium album]SDH96360.1 Methyltransferase domain-containing protein [Sinosporangium album]
MTEQVSAAELWDTRYRESERIWSGNPNKALVREVSDVEPGTALDLGCGEGADAVWLARRGWSVTATDVSQVALDRAAGHAAEENVGDRIDWQWHDLAVSFPEGAFDLVSTHFLHSHGEMPRERILRTAAGAVSPGGTLLIVGHSGRPTWEVPPDFDVELPASKDVLAALELAPGEWEVQVCEEHERPHPAPDGSPGMWVDAVVKVRRR